MKKISDRIRKELPEGQYAHTCPFDAKQCDEIQLHLSGDSNSAICRHGGCWDPKQGCAPCERFVEEDRKRKKSKQKIKRKPTHSMKKKNCGCK